MRPIVWGFILTVVGAFFWILLSVILGVGTALGGEPPPPSLMALLYISGIAMYFSLPISIVIEIYKWIKKRKAKS